MPEATFTDRSALVTGAIRGIGQAIASESGRRGGHVLAAGPDRERGETVAGQVRSHGGRAGFIPADPRDAAPAQDLARRATQVAGKVDLLASNAGSPCPVRPGRPAKRTPTPPTGVEEPNGVLDDAST